MEEEIKKIVKDNPYNSFDLNNAELEDIIEEASYFSLFDELKYMVVKNANIFLPSKRKKKEDDETSENEDEKVSKKDEVLLKYLESPNANTVLIFTVYGKVDVRKKIGKIVKDRYTLIEIPEMKGDTLVNTAIKLLSNDGFKIDKDTALYIVNNCLGNYDLVINEIEKIKLYYDKPIKLTIDNICEIVSKNIEDNNFKFIDTVMSRNIKESFRLLDDLMIQKVEPIMLLSMFAKEVRNMLIVKKMHKKLDAKSLVAMLGFKTEWQLDKIYRVMNNYTVGELESLLMFLCDVDLKIKTGRISNKLALEMFIMELCK
jgi:DNA polymerase-3 subunit delta